MLLKNHLNQLNSSVIVCSLDFVLPEVYWKRSSQWLYFGNVKLLPSSLFIAIFRFYSLLVVMGTAAELDLWNQFNCTVLLVLLLVQNPPHLYHCPPLGGHRDLNSTTLTLSILTSLPTVTHLQLLRLQCYCSSERVCACVCVQHPPGRGAPGAPRTATCFPPRRWCKGHRSGSETKGQFCFT